jgi:hypothetical protein
VQIGKTAGDDEVAESNDAIDVEYAFLIEDNKAGESHASSVATHAIESFIHAEANEAEDADGKNSRKDLTSNDEIFDDNSTCSESICGGDSINYYDSISEWLQSFLIDPDDEYLLTLSTCDIVPKGSKVRRITKY